MDKICKISYYNYINSLQVKYGLLFLHIGGTPVKCHEMYCVYCIVKYINVFYNLLLELNM